MEDILDVTASHARIDDVTLILMHRGGNSFAACYLGVQSLQLVVVWAST